MVAFSCNFFMPNICQINQFYAPTWHLTILKKIEDNMVMFLKGLNNMSDRSSIAFSPDYSSYTSRGDKALRKALSVREDNCSPSIQDSKPNRSLIKESIKQSLSFLDIRKY